MNLDDRIRAALNEEAEVRTTARPDVQRLIRGGRARRRRRHAVWAGGAVLAAVIAVVGAYAVQVRDTRAVDLVTGLPAPQPMPDSGEPVAIDAGTYVVPRSSDAVVAPYTITVPSGWLVQHGVVVSKQWDEQHALVVVDSFVLDRIRLAEDACHGPGSLGPEVASVADLVSGLRAQVSGPRVGDPVAATVGGLPATRIDLAYPARRPLSGCRLSVDDPSLGEGWLQVSSGYLVMSPAESVSVYVVDTSGAAQVFVTKTSDGASAADRAELQSILDSIRVRGPL